MKKSTTKILLLAAVAGFLLCTIICSTCLLGFTGIYVFGAVVPTIKEGKEFGEDKQEKVTWVNAKLDEESGHAVYNGELYFYEEDIDIDYVGKIRINSEDADANLLSWEYNFLFYGTERYYSYSEESPDFLIHQWLKVLNVCTNESFDFRNQPFYAEEIEGQLYLHEMYIDEAPVDLFRDHPREAQFYLYCSEHPELRLTALIKLYNSEYYISFDTGRTSYKVSEDFLKVLKENQIIA